MANAFWAPPLNLADIMRSNCKRRVLKVSKDLVGMLIILLDALQERVTEYLSKILKYTKATKSLRKRGSGDGRVVSKVAFRPSGPGFHSPQTLFWIIFFSLLKDGPFPAYFSLFFSSLF